MTDPVIDSLVDVLLDLDFTEDDLVPLAALSDALVDLGLDEDEGETDD